MGRWAIWRQAGRQAVALLALLALLLPPPSGLAQALARDLVQDLAADPAAGSGSPFGSLVICSPGGILLLALDAEGRPLEQPPRQRGGGHDCGLCPLQCGAPAVPVASAGGASVVPVAQALPCRPDPAPAGGALLRHALHPRAPPPL